MNEWRSRIFRSNGDKVYFSRSAGGQYRWVDAMTNLGVPDIKAHGLDFLYVSNANHKRTKSNSNETKADAHTTAVIDEDGRTIDAIDTIIPCGGEEEDTHYASALDDMDNLTEIGLGYETMTEYSDDEEHPADAVEDYPAEMVA